MLRVSWGVWFAIPLIAGGDWTLSRICVGIGLGPGIAAVLLDQLQPLSPPGGERVAEGRVRGWWSCFAVVGLAVMAICIWSLLTGDARTAAELSAARPPGLTALSILSAMGSSAVCGFIFASAAASRSATLHSIIRWRASWRWWAVALFLPATLLAVSWSSRWFPASAWSRSLPDCRSPDGSRLSPGRRFSRC